MKTLRLILWRDCPRSCRTCVNKTLPPQTKFDGDYTGYDEIVLTGGEPLMYPKKLFARIAEIRKQTAAPIYVYTAIVSIPLVNTLVRLVDGITLSLHDMSTPGKIPKLTEHLIQMGLVEGKSLRLNSFVSMNITSDIDYVWDWDIRDYIVDCPIPMNETVMEVR